MAGRRFRVNRTAADWSKSAATDADFPSHTRSTARGDIRNGRICISMKCDPVSTDDRLVMAACLRSVPFSQVRARLSEPLAETPSVSRTGKQFFTLPPIIPVCLLFYISFSLSPLPHFLFYRRHFHYLPLLVEL